MESIFMNHGKFPPPPPRALLEVKIDLEDANITHLRHEKNR